MESTQQNKEFVKKYSLHITVFLIALVLGGSYMYTTHQEQAAKRWKIEMEINQKQKELEAEEKRRIQERTDKAYRDLELATCLQTADEGYWTYIELNGFQEPEHIGTDVWSAAQRDWDTATKNKERAIDNCYRAHGK